MTPEERAAVDPAFLEAVAAAYDGPYAVADLLHWLESPLESGPSGTPSPAARLAELRSVVYGPNAAANAVERYETARTAWEADRASIEAAVAEQSPAATPAGDPGSEVIVSGAEPSDPAEVVDADGRSGTAGDRAPSPLAGEGPGVFERLWPRFVAGATAVLVVFGAGLLLGSGTSGGARAGATPTASASSAIPAPGSSVHVVEGPLAMFEGPQQPMDRPSIDVGSQLVRSSFRYAETLGNLAAQMYAAKNVDGDLCLVIVTADAHVTASCEPLSAFIKSGIRLDVTINQDPPDDRDLETRVEVLCSWTPAGTEPGGVFAWTIPQS